MKISSCIVIALIIAGFFLIQGYPAVKTMQNSGSIYTTAVKKVIDNKCYGCHSNNGKSQVAKNALMWDNLPDLQKKELVAHLDKIIRVLRKNTMPPESAVKRNPDMKLLPEESKLLQSWAEAKADSLLN
ncbi:MAG: hypothetical protein GT600_11210 [Bacteroidales bacterium]|jgi:uncharacterized membrane protein|nr:hypothetical protein [Bacteroidales bacterium]NMD04066.1 heme-binding domain-containing protein [Bacteroidales bacterium]OQB59792.1 MAG: hypothetical protein BWX96_02548 [Bacteroidetes bacterium ADurb.Bin145]HOU02957.1 hypothetical protein [Bacteroidales bacterium]HQK69065.1 hypothetical protein [Bacteroidales bacterium]